MTGSHEWRRSNPAAAATLLGAYALLGGGLSFLGWPLDVVRLTDWFNDGVCIQPNACVLLMLSGAAVIFAQRGAWRTVGALGFLVGSGGALILLQYVVGADFGFNHLLLFGRTWGQETTFSPGRVGPPGSISFTLVGTSLVLFAVAGLQPQREWLRRYVPMLGIAECTMMLFSLFGYLFAARQFYTIPWLTAIALQTATMLLALGMGLVVSVPEYQPMRLLRERSGAGALARVAIPALLVMIPLVLWLRLQGFEAGYFDLGTGRALGALALVAGTMTLLWVPLMALRRHEQALRDSEDRLRSIIEQLPAGVGVIDVAGQWTLTNSLMTEYVPSAIPSADPHRDDRWQAFDEHGQPIPTERWPGKRALAGETVLPGLAMRSTGTDGQQSWMRISAAPLRDASGRIVGATCVAQDITQIKAAEDSLREHSQQLELLRKELQQRVEELAVADRRKDEFLATLAHELRNPLSPLMNSLSLLENCRENSDVAATARDTMRRQLQHMVRLVDDLLDVSRISRGAIEIRKETVRVQSLVRDAVDAARSVCEAAEQRLEVHTPPQPVWVEADPARLMQIIGNLLSNASRYSGRGTQISLHASCEGRDLLVRVTDQGHGIAPEHLDSIFDMFVQVDQSLERTTGGLGIGLYLVRRLVEMHGGSVRAHSDGAGMGSEFVVRLPVVVEQELPHQLASPPKPHLLAKSVHSLRVLVVDDNRDAATTMAMLLQAHGHVTQTAHDGLQALETTRTFEPHVVLLDIGLPGVNGYEACQQIRRQPNGDKVVVIALTGWGQEKDKRRAAEVGFDAHLVKPVETGELLALLANAADPEAQPLASRN